MKSKKVSKVLSSAVITLISAFWLTGLGGCSTQKPFHPAEGEDYVATEPGQTITTPARTGAWLSDRYIEIVFEGCPR